MCDLAKLCYLRTIVITIKNPSLPEKFNSNANDGLYRLAVSVGKQAPTTWVLNMQLKYKHTVIRDVLDFYWQAYHVDQAYRHIQRYKCKNHGKK